MTALYTLLPEAVAIVRADSKAAIFDRVADEIIRSVVAV